jgi:Tol biopolymer transport system component
MKAMDFISYNFRISVTILAMFHPISFFGQTWECQILPSERQVVTDQSSGARITFITTDKSDDRNLYFHDRCWLLDQTVMLFHSDRTGRTEIYGYFSDTGELIRFNRDDDPPASNPVASKKGDKFYMKPGQQLRKQKFVIFRRKLNRSTP